jgi:effector-binding domain-containing protein
MTTSQECDLVDCKPQLLAVTEAVVAPGSVPKYIIGMFDIVYAWRQRSGARQTGHNYGIYLPISGGLRIQVGFPVAERFADDEQVKCIELPAGRAAHIPYFGDYRGLDVAYRRLEKWCAAQGIHTDGKLSWEVYGDPAADLTHNRTDVYILIEPV